MEEEDDMADDECSPVESRREEYESLDPGYASLPLSLRNSVQAGS